MSSLPCFSSTRRCKSKCTENCYTTISLGKYIQKKSPIIPLPLLTPFALLLALTPLLSFLALRSINLKKNVISVFLLQQCSADVSHLYLYNSRTGNKHDFPIATLHFLMRHHSSSLFTKNYVGHNEVLLPHYYSTEGFGRLSGNSLLYMKEFLMVKDWHSPPCACGEQGMLRGVQDGI